MPPIDEFASHCIELLSPLGPVRQRRMFGAFGLYIDDCFVAIVADEQLWLKSDAQSQARFEAAGCPPFRYQRQGQWTTMGFHRPPEEALDSPALMLPWARLALDAALRARAPARKSLSRPAKPPAPKRRKDG